MELESFADMTRRRFQEQEVMIAVLSLLIAGQWVAVVLMMVKLWALG